MVFKSSKVQKFNGISRLFQPFKPFNRCAPFKPSDQQLGSYRSSRSIHRIECGVRSNRAALAAVPSSGFKVQGNTKRLVTAEHN